METTFIVEKESIYDSQITALVTDDGIYLGFVDIYEEEERFVVVVTISTEALLEAGKTQVPRRMSHRERRRDDKT